MANELIINVDCANNQQAQVDCTVSIIGSLIEIKGYSIMHFTPNDAAILGSALINAASKVGWKPLLDNINEF